jgi:tetratricopeptide (TPR) repeat protein
VTLLTPPISEPTAAFNDRCLVVIRRWESGLLPFEAALDEMRQLSRDATLRRHAAEQARAEGLLGYLEGYRGNLNASIRHFERSRALFHEVGNVHRVAICDLNLGESYRYKGDFSRASALFDKAYSAFRELSVLEDEALALGNKGQMLLSMGRLPEAEADLRESYRLTLQIPADGDNRNSLLCELHHALCLLYLRRQMVEDAWHEADAAYQMGMKDAGALGKGFACRAVGEALTHTETCPEGFTPDPDMYFQIANEAFRDINAEGEMARTMFAHARSLARRGRRMTAARKLQHAMIIFTRLGMVDDAARAAEAQLEIL